MFIDNLAQVANLDLGFALDTMMRQGITGVMDMPMMLDAMDLYINAKDGEMVDYYSAGVVGGKLIKKMFDLNINNWS